MGGKRRNIKQKLVVATDTVLKMLPKTKNPVGSNSDTTSVSCSAKETKRIPKPVPKLVPLANPANSGTVCPPMPLCQAQKAATKDVKMALKANVPVAPRIRIVKQPKTFIVPNKNISLNKNKVITDFAVQKFIDNSNVRSLILKDMKCFNKGDPQKIFIYAKKILTHFHDKSLVTYRDGTKFIGKLHYKSFDKEMDIKLLLATPAIQSEKQLHEHKRFLKSNNFKIPYVDMSIDNLAFIEHRRQCHGKQQYPKTWEHKMPSTAKLIQQGYNKNFSICYLKKYSNITDVVKELQAKHNYDEETSYLEFMKLDKRGEVWAKLQFHNAEIGNCSTADRSAPDGASTSNSSPSVKTIHDEEALTFGEFVKYTNILELITYILDDINDPDELNELLKRNYEAYYNYPDRSNFSLLRELVFKKRPMESKIKAAIGKQTLNEIIDIITISSDESDTEAIMDDMVGLNSIIDDINRDLDMNGKLHKTFSKNAHTSATNFTLHDATSGCSIYAEHRDRPSTSGHRHLGCVRKEHIQKIANIMDDAATDSRPNTLADYVMFSNSEKENRKILYKTFKRNSNVQSFLANSIRKQFSPVLAEKHLATLDRKVKLYFNRYILNRDSYPPMIKFTHGWSAEIFAQLQERSKGFEYVNVVTSTKKVFSDNARNTNSSASVPVAKTSHNMPGGKMFNIKKVNRILEALEDDGRKRMDRCNKVHNNSTSRVPPITTDADSWQAFSKSMQNIQESCEEIDFKYVNECLRVMNIEGNDSDEY